jgi:response regulator of citrate/malate metabolism
MTLEELQQAIDKDLQINDTELDLESLKTPQLHNKYLKHLNNYKLLTSRAQTDYSTTKREKWEYYTGKAPAEVYALKPFDLKILKTDIDKYLESDEDLQKLKQKVDYLQTTVDYLDRTIRLISNRGFTIKNAIDWRKFTSGAI